MSLQKEARNKIQEVNLLIGCLPETVQMFTLVTLYHTLEELYFQEKYSLVSDICDALLKDGNLN